MPSDLIVEIVEIKEINIHPNADRLELATVKGWQCVVQKNIFKPGDKVVYLPIDSVLPPELEAKLFPPESKIKLTKSRIKTIKIRKAISQGMIVPLDKVGLSHGLAVGTDVKDKLNITKYEPPKKPASLCGGHQRSKKQINPHFRKYTGINNIKNYPDAFEGKDVVITEKIHGTNFRAGYVPFVPTTLRQKIVAKFKFLQKIFSQPKYEFVYGSHNVQLQNKGKTDKVYYDNNVYYEATEKYNLKESLSDGEVVYGEIYGYGIQKNYTYGCGYGEHKLIVFDIMKDGQYLSHKELVNFCSNAGLEMPPVLYIGPYSQKEIDKATIGKSVLAPNAQPVREGCVVRTLEESMFYGGRAILKSINLAYLLKDQSEWT